MCDLVQILWCSYLRDFRLSTCIRYFSIAVLKHHDQNQLVKDFIFSFNSDKSPSWYGTDMATSLRHRGRNRKVRDDINLKHKAKRKNGKTMNSQSLLLVMSFIQQGTSIFPNSATNCGPSAQIAKHIDDILTKITTQSLEIVKIVQYSH